MHLRSSTFGVAGFKNEIKRLIDSNQYQEYRFLVACSGGSDSMVLAELCLASELNFSIAHINYKLRGIESDGDENFVKDWGKRNRIDTFINQVNTKAEAKKQGKSIQIFAREFRYEWFYELLKSLKFDFIITAHHANDNAETLLINLSKGSVLQGLTGIPEINNAVIRPLLNYSKNEITDYAKKNGIAYREDSSNQNTNYYRNKIRHEVIPKLEELNPNLLHTLRVSNNQRKDIQGLISELSNNLLLPSTQLANGLVSYRVKDLQQFSRFPYIFMELFKSTELNYKQALSIGELLTNKSKGHIETINGTEIVISQQEIIFSNQKNEHLPNEYVLNLNKDKLLNTEWGSFFISPLSNRSKKFSKYELLIDKAILQNELIKVRNFRIGDKIKLPNIKGSKKVGDVFTDEKINDKTRTSIPLLELNGEIIWIAGLRSARNLVNMEENGDVIEIKWIPNL
jgi:tRNA(Ile)-lysidine synthase